MTDLLAARSQMAMSLAFHIIFAVVGMGMPLLMCIAEGMWLRTGEPVYLELAKRWSKGTAILFAVGAVSGTVLSFELGLLWPTFMEFAGPIISMPFSLEGFAFFFEAIFLGIYLYGWNRVPRMMHWFAGWIVLISGTMSGVFVVCANAWMNNPTGYEYVDGELVIDPVAAMMNPGAYPQALHMVAAAFVTVGFMVSGAHAWLLRRDRTNAFHRRGLAIALSVAVVGAVVQPITGHTAAEFVAHSQPVKLAAAEAQWETKTYAPLTLGGWPDEQAEVTRYGLEIPGALSFLAFGDPAAEVQGLKETPVQDRPSVVVVHLAYQVMLGMAGVMGGVAALTVGLVLFRRKLPDDPRYLLLLAIVSPAGIIAIEAGWVVTEVGRQPWVIQGVMRTADAVTPMPGLIVPFTLFSVLYLFLAAASISLLARQFRHSPYVEETS